MHCRNAATLRKKCQYVGGGKTRGKMYLPTDSVGRSRLPDVSSELTTPHYPVRSSRRANDMENLHIDAANFSVVSDECCGSMSINNRCTIRQDVPTPQLEEPD